MKNNKSWSGTIVVDGKRKSHGNKKEKESDRDAARRKDTVWGFVGLKTLAEDSGEPRHAIRDL